MKTDSEILEKESYLESKILKKESKIVFFSGVKGGCGSSFILNCSAAYLSKTKNKNIVLVDLNTGKKDSRIIFNISNDVSRDLGDLENGFNDLDISVLKRLVLNFESSINLIIPSLKFEKRNFFEEKKIGSFFNFLCEIFDLILVDFPYYLLLSKNFDFLEYPDKFVFIAQPDFISINNLEILIKNLFPDGNLYKFLIIVNKFNLKPYISPARIINIIGYPIVSFIAYDRDIEYLYLTKGPFPVFNYSLRVVKNIIDFSENLYSGLFQKDF